MSDRVPALVRRLVSALLTLGIAVLLAACTITSDKPLIEAGEGATPLPDSFTFVPYDSSDNGYVPSKDDTVHFERHDDHYTAQQGFDMKGPLDIRLVPLSESLYLFEASTADEDGILYGFARYSDSVLSVQIAPDASTATALAKAHSGAMPQQKKALAGIKIDKRTDAITVLNRPSLDYLAKLFVDGHLPMHQAAVAFLSLEDGDDAPARLLPDGTHWVHGS